VELQVHLNKLNQLKRKPEEQLRRKVKENNNKVKANNNKQSLPRNPLILYSRRDPRTLESVKEFNQNVI